MLERKSGSEGDMVSQPFSMELIHKLQWDDLRIFLRVAQAGSFRKAASEFNLSINTLRLRIERLENSLQSKIIERDFEGIALTAEGLQLQRIAEGMVEGAARTLGIETNRLVRPGQITIGAPYALGAGWLPPLLPKLEPEVHGLEMNLVCHHDLTIEHDRRIDVGLSWGMPVDDRLIASRIASIHLMPYASKSYARRRGLPTKPDELLNHHYIEQVGSDLKPSLINNIVEAVKPEKVMRMTTNSSAALLCAVATGQGIGFLPTYASAIFSELQPIDMGLYLKRDLFCYYHARAKTSKAIRAAVDWLKDSFDAERFPWFSANFVNPTEFDERLNAASYRKWGPVQQDASSLDRSHAG